MFLKPAITRYKLYILANRLINTLNSEKVFEFSKIALWRNKAQNNPAEALSDMADNIKSLRVETLKDYEIKSVNTHKEGDRNNDD